MRTSHIIRPRPSPRGPIALLAAILLPFAPGVISPALAQTGTAQGQVSALLLEPMSLINTDALDFGSIIASPAGGDVVVDPAGAISTTGGMIVLPGTARAARFAGQGSASRVLIKTGSNQIFLTGPGTQMRVDDFTIGALSGLSQIGNGNNFRITSTNGLVGFAVGGRLRVNANQAPGDYSGSFTVTFNYQ